LPHARHPRWFSTKPICRRGVLRRSQKVFLMLHTRRHWSPEIRRQMVNLVRAGRDPADLFEASAEEIRNWVL
jgi:hypothetical protein